jgi:hypothetical protein
LHVQSDENELVPVEASINFADSIASDVGFGNASERVSCNLTIRLLSCLSWVKRDATQRQAVGPFIVPKNKRPEYLQGPQPSQKNSQN